MENTTNNYVLQLKHVDQAYGDRVVVSDINLKVRDGEVVTIVGPTGCGKSTVLRMLLGSEKAAKGIATMNGKEITEPNKERGIVFQKYSLFPDKTVQENVMFGLELQYYSLFEVALRKLSFGLYKRKKQEEFLSQTQQYLEKVGLWDSRDKYPFELSGGMNQRAAIAQALIMKPPVLLMDEPHGALDASTRQEMQIFVLDQWKETKCTIFFVTHDLEEALFIGTRLILLSPYYQHENGEQGSKIVKDIQLPWTHPRPTSIIGTDEFKKLVEEIKREGLNPKHLQSVKDFDLTHADAEKII